MKSTNRILRGLRLATPCGLLCLVASSAAAGSSRNEAEADDSTLERHRAEAIFAQSHGVNERDGRLYGDGPDYRAAFEAGRLTFTPALGSAADHALPVAFALEEIRVGEETILAADPRVAPARVADERIVYHRAGGIEERYEVRADGVHQSFLFPTPPAGGGELVVRGRIRTALDSVPAVDGARFERAGLGGVAWGGVTGVDANGWTAAGEVRVKGDVIELALPASFVAQAAYPLLLDPLIGTTFDVMNTGWEDNYPDVAYDVSENVYLVVWARTFAYDAIAVRGQRLNSAGGLEGGLIAISDPIPEGGRLSTTPTVASVNSSNRFFVAWRERLGPLAVSDIFGAAVRADNGDVSSTIAIAPSVGHQTDPAAGGERTLIDDDVVLVWAEQFTGIRVCQVQVPPAGDLTPPAFTQILEADSGSIENRHPAISKSAGESGHFCVAWERWDTTGTQTANGDGRIEAQIVNRNATIYGQNVTVSTGNDTYTSEQPAVDGDGDHWVIAWQRQEVFFPLKYNVMTRAGARIGTLLDFKWPQHYLESDIDDDEHAPTVAWTGSRAVVAYVDEAPGASQVYLASVDPYTGFLGEGPMYAATAVGSVWSMGSASGWSGAGVGAPMDDALVVFGHVPAMTTQGDILAVRYDTPDEPSDLGGGMTDGGANVHPMLHEGNANFRAHLRGALPSSLTLFVLSKWTAPFPCGVGTWIPSLAPARFTALRTTDANGHASIAAAVPAGSAGFHAYSQWATWAPGTGCWVGGSEFTFSNALEMTVQP